MSTGCMLVPHPQPCPQLCSMSLGSRHALPMNSRTRAEGGPNHDTSILAPTGNPCPGRSALLQGAARAILGRWKAGVWPSQPGDV